MAETNRQDQPDRSGLDDRLLDILVCPLCKESVQEEPGAVVCPQCGRRYPVRDGVAVMLPDEAELPSAPAGGETESGEG
jgi:hypothetical protein